MRNRIETLKTLLICGKSLRMSFVNDRTQELWRSFATLVRKVPFRLGTDFISMQIFDRPLELRRFDPGTEFIKWAGVPVSNDYRRDDPKAREEIWIPIRNKSAQQ